MSSLKFILKKEVTEEEYEEAYNTLYKIMFFGTIISFLTIIL